MTSIGLGQCPPGCVPKQKILAASMQNLAVEKKAPMLNALASLITEEENIQSMSKAAVKKLRETYTNLFGDPRSETVKNWWIQTKLILDRRPALLAAEYTSDLLREVQTAMILAEKLMIFDHQDHYRDHHSSVGQSLELRKDPSSNFSDEDGCIFNRKAEDKHKEEKKILEDVFGQEEEESDEESDDERDAQEGTTKIWPKRVVEEAMSKPEIWHTRYTYDFLTGVEDIMDLVHEIIHRETITDKHEIPEKGDNTHGKLADFVDIHRVPWDESDEVSGIEKSSQSTDYPNERILRNKS
ncbi:hypothetical protein BKA64DRAFT_643407 [Cadophora sp. MPI-SDFR-AT-0126]|nr:hypothetical protein BKA64DRAFT_643407 [Leotiomycetes sp. MPI-SDFR-AT-0126]